MRAGERWGFSVAGFGQKLRGNDALDTMGYRDFADMVHAANPDDPHGYWAEFRRLADLAAGLAGEGPCTAPAVNRNCR